MDGRLSFVYLPVREMKRALAFYRDQLGLDESWREGDGTVALKVPGTEVELMLDLVEEETSAGPMFIIPSVDEFYRANRDEMQFITQPRDIPPGRMITVKDPSGNLLSFIDMSKRS